jgi:hypothetical protein
MIPPEWRRLGFTSGRRTYRGNKLVGGVPDSEHLHGTAADFTAPLSVLQAQFPGKRILDEGDHRHVSGLSDVPYYGNRGIAGLVNGVDTTAPKGGTMLQPRKPAQRRPGGILSDIPQPDPILTDVQNPLAMAQMQGGPLATNLEAPKPGFFGKGGKGWGILGILGDAMAAYGGQRGVFTPYMMQQQENELEDNRWREKLAADIEAKRQDRLAKAMEPPSFVRDAQAFAGLTPQQREQVIRMRDALYPVVADIQDDEGRVIRKQIPRTATPMPGDVEDGHVFMGGDPADPNNWRRM